jgi:hypothetical protein
MGSADRRALFILPLLLDQGVDREGALTLWDRIVGDLLVLVSPIDEFARQCREVGGGIRHVYRDLVDSAVLSPAVRPFLGQLHLTGEDELHLVALAGARYGQILTRK